MDIILDANAYIQALYNNGRGFLQTNQFAELLTYLRRTGSRLVIPEMTYNEVLARYQDRLSSVSKAARGAWTTLQKVGINSRIDFPELDINHEVSDLGNLLINPTPGVKVLLYDDYSGVSIKEVAQRGISRKCPANEKGEELRDVILWLVVLQYATQSSATVAFVSGDKTFQDNEGALDPSLREDVERAQVKINFYPLIRDFVKGNALEVEPIQQSVLAPHISVDELRLISTKQLLGSQFWDGTTVGAEVDRCDFADARRYRVGEDSFYIEARYTGEGRIHIARFTYFSSGLPAGLYGNYAPSYPNILGVATLGYQPDESIFAPQTPLKNETTFIPSVFSPALPQNIVASAQTTESEYRCSFSLRLSLRLARDKREALEVDEFVLLGELAPITNSGA